jgi:hypothetical protein
MSCAHLHVYQTVYAAAVAAAAAAPAAAAAAAAAGLDASTAEVALILASRECT